MTLWIGIDCGMLGAVAIEDDESGERWLFKTPTENGAYQEEEFYKLLQGFWFYAPNWHATLEMQQIYKSNKNMQVAGGLMHCYGAWLTVLKLLKIPFRCVLPTEWKEVQLCGYGGKTAEKKYSIVVARQLYPDWKISGTPSDGDADAVLIMDFGKGVNNVRRNKEEAPGAVEGGTTTATIDNQSGASKPKRKAKKDSDTVVGRKNKMVKQPPGGTGYTIEFAIEHNDCSLGKCLVKGTTFRPCVIYHAGKIQDDIRRESQGKAGVTVCSPESVR